jgi:hypothetical protein
MNDSTLYGGIENAVKSTDHELKGLIALMHVLAHSPVHFPLMCVVEYGGFRIIASAALPLDSKTIVYVRQFFKAILTFIRDLAILAIL